MLRYRAIFFNEIPTPVITADAHALCVTAPHVGKPAGPGQQTPTSCPLSSHGVTWVWAPGQRSPKGETRCTNFDRRQFACRTGEENQFECCLFVRGRENGVGE
ncbi:hypothetical protein PAPYR_990 [Paratrimastix pyriformis]|uniref:Uncharacterized protein n=1 Tax=Paratrimastix pyriformis TaxID=342808 RepID=A0ABQ8UUZ3_9EUKA|nr:hypothetical protein PAPYR_990 [Paratrimastix pyriformis]